MSGWCSALCGLAGMRTLIVLECDLVDSAVVLGRRDAGVRSGGGVLVLLVVPWSLALQERRSLCGMDL